MSSSAPAVNDDSIEKLIELVRENRRLYVYDPQNPDHIYLYGRHQDHNYTYIGPASKRNWSVPTLK